jgi:3-phosphoshikimate 1-carboxyvinyltransferase
MNFLVSPSSGLRGHIKVAGDKSISHRAVIFGAIADGVTRVSEILEGEDVMATIEAFRAMGIRITRTGSDTADNCYEIEGKGLHGLEQPESELDMGNSGTAFRLLTGLLCAQPWSSRLTGDDSLRQRPMGRIISPLQQMGAQIASTDNKPPLIISPVSQLTGIDYDSPVASAQVKSAILLAGLYASGFTSVSESATTRDHTERMLEGFGCAVRKSGNTVTVPGGSRLLPQDIVVPADLSSAAFFMLAALITPGSHLTLQKVGVNPSRNGVLRVLQRMGGDIKLTNQSTVSGEPVADIIVATSNLTGCDVAGEDVALAIDEIPVIAVAAAHARGITRVSGASELRVKESDRIRSVVNGLQALAINVTENSDGMIIEGGTLTAGRVNSYGDHRIAMAFSMAGAGADGTVEVLDCNNVATSFPNFYELARQSGVNIAIS